MNEVAKLNLEDLKNIIRQIIQEMLLLPAVDLERLGWSHDKLSLIRDQLVAFTDELGKETPIVAELNLNDLKQMILQTIQEMLTLPSDELSRLGWSHDKLVLTRYQLAAFAEHWNNPNS